jgi:hypothetical protein
MTDREFQTYKHRECKPTERHRAPTGIADLMKDAPVALAYRAEYEGLMVLWWAVGIDVARGEQLSAPPQHRWSAQRILSSDGE